MQKLGMSVLEVMVKSSVTSKEIDFILWIARYQNDYGTARGIHYKELCTDIDLSYQGFYDCKKSLEEKGIIKCYKDNYFDWDITICNNNFKGKENYGRGYISLHCNMVRSEQFRKCKAGTKLIGLWLMREWKINLKQSGKLSYQMLRTTFYNKFKPLFGTSKRVLRRYLGELEPFMSIYLENGTKYFFTFKDEAVKANNRDGENNELREHDVYVGCRRNKIKDLPKKVAKELCGILCQHHKAIEQLFEYDFTKVIRDSLERMNQTRKSKNWKRVVNVALVHKVLVEAL